LHANIVLDKYKDITTFGPVSQGEFLKAMGIDFRLVELLKKLDENDPRAEQLISGYERLVGTEEGQMGASYKAWALTSKGVTPAGFDTAKTPYDDDL
jgi:NADH dehydrogenase [ubiquinone] 1 alpha subcomplex assembly factor 7